MMQSDGGAEEKEKDERGVLMKVSLKAKLVVLQVG
jgi:hypothetical protein